MSDQDPRLPAEAQQSSVPAAGAVLAGAGVAVGGVASVSISARSSTALASGITKAHEEIISAAVKLALGVSRKTTGGVRVPEIERRAEAFRKASNARVRAGVLRASKLPSRKEVIREIEKRIREENRKTAPSRAVLARLERAAARASAGPDPRVTAVRGVLAREKRYAQEHAKAQVARAYGANNQMVLERESPRGAFWELDPLVANHTADCCTPDSVVDSQGVVGAMRRWYSGPIVDAVTTQGRSLSVTPNHPVLTRNGWVPAGALNEGDNLVYTEIRQGAPSGDRNLQNGPALATEVFSALASMEGLRRSKLPGGPEDFHGDGQDGNIEVVGAYGALAVDCETSLSETCGDLYLPLSDEGIDALVQECVAFETGEGPLAVGIGTSKVNASGYEAVCDMCAGKAQALSHGVDRLSIGVRGKEVWTGGSGRPFGKPEMPNDRPGLVPPDLESVREGVHAEAVRVQLEEILSVTVREYRGWVYNFVTRGHWYTVDNLAVHNCVLMAGRVLPHEVLRKFRPPLHVGCACRLRAATPADGDALSVESALALMRAAESLREEDADAIWALHLLVESGALESGLEEGLVSDLQTRGLFREERWRRDSKGRFKDYIFQLGVGQNIMLPDRTRVTRREDHFVVRRAGRPIRHYFEAEGGVEAAAKAAASDALNRSARGGQENSLGGGERFQSFNDYVDRTGGGVPEPVPAPEPEAGSGIPSDLADLRGPELMRRVRVGDRVGSTEGTIHTVVGINGETITVRNDAGSELEVEAGDFYPQMRLWPRAQGISTLAVGETRQIGQAEITRLADAPISRTRLYSVNGRGVFNLANAEAAARGEGRGTVLAQSLMIGDRVTWGTGTATYEVVNITDSGEIWLEYGELRRYWQPDEVPDDLRRADGEPSTPDPVAGTDRRRSLRGTDLARQLQVGDYVTWGARFIGFRIDTIADDGTIRASSSEGGQQTWDPNGAPGDLELVSPNFVERGPAFPEEDEAERPIRASLGGETLMRNLQVGDYVSLSDGYGNRAVWEVAGVRSDEVEFRRDGTDQRRFVSYTGAYAQGASWADGPDTPTPGPLPSPTITPAPRDQAVAAYIDQLRAVGVASGVSGMDAPRVEHVGGFFYVTGSGRTYVVKEAVMRGTEEPTDQNVRVYLDGLSYTAPDFANGIRRTQGLTAGSYGSTRDGPVPAGWPTPAEIVSHRVGVQSTVGGATTPASPSARLALRGPELGAVLVPQDQMRFMPEGPILRVISAGPENIVFLNTVTNEERSTRRDGLPTLTRLVSPAGESDPERTARLAQERRERIDMMVSRANISEDRARIILEGLDGVQLGDYVSVVESWGYGRLQGTVYKMPERISAGTFSRDIAERSVYHASFQMNENHKGTGFGELFISQSFEAYRRAGFEKVTVGAGLSTGGYKWAKMGFKFRGGSNARDVLLSQSHKLRNAPVSEDLKLAFKRMVNNGLIKHPQDMAEFGIDTTWTETINGKEITWWLGKWLLMGSGWDGVYKL